METSRCGFCPTISIGMTVEAVSCAHFCKLNFDCQRIIANGTRKM